MLPFLPESPPRGVAKRTNWVILWAGCVGALMASGAARAEPAPAAGSLVEQGRALFVRQWQEVDEQSPAGDGLGPMFNAHACVDCHNQGGVGGSAGRDKNVDMLHVIPPQGVERVNRQTLLAGLARIHPNLVANGSNGLTVVPSITLHRYGTNPAYEKWRVALLILTDHLRPGEVPERIGLAVSQRRAPALFGAGLIDSIPREVLEKTARRQNKAHPELRGRVALANDRTAGKFGWRGQTATLKQFVMGACANELGLHAPANDQPRDPLDPNYEPPGLDLHQDQCDALVAFVASLPPPAERQALSAKQKDLWAAGSVMFKRVGCVDCHQPTLGDVEGIYSDLLLHDMGQELADPAGANSLSITNTIPLIAGYYGGGQSIFETAPPETKRQWRTPPLWGVANSAPYLHDGRARTLHEAILAHDGEATSSRRRYTALAAENREKLLAFLQSVGQPRR